MERASCPEKMINSRRILAGKYERKRELGRTRCIWNCETKVI